MGAGFLAEARERYRREQEMFRQGTVGPVMRGQSLFPIPESALVPGDPPSWRGGYVRGSVDHSDRRPKPSGT